MNDPPIPQNDPEVQAGLFHDTHHGDDKYWLYERFARLMAAAVERDSETTSGIFVEVASRLGDSGVFALCCALAEAVRQYVFPGFTPGDGSLSGDIAVLEKLTDGPDHPPTLWATRFVAAYLNGDQDTSTALFFGAADDDEELLIAGLVELVEMAADLARQKQAQRD
jgi:hypothetical protein